MKYWAGVFTGILLAAFQLVIFTSVVSRSGHHVSWRLSKEFANYDWSLAYELRGDYLDKQALALITAPKFNLSADYRMILFERSGRILICAGSSADLPTGFVFPTQNGLKTFLPNESGIIFEIKKICSIRI